VAYDIMRGAKGLAVSKSHPLDKKSEDMHLKWPIMREREREKKVQKTPVSESHILGTLFMG
jgi:hypothetical protein